jgi:C1A family cysteine protease
MGGLTSYLHYESPELDSPPLRPKYKWRRQLPDKRDHHAQLDPVKAWPRELSLVNKCPVVYNQGNLGSCTAQALAFAYEYSEMNQECLTEFFIPSRLFIYYNERAMEGHVSTDSGGDLRDGIKSLNTTGCCPESMWPYDVTQYRLRPYESCYTDAYSHKCVKYGALNQTLEEMKACLQGGKPFVFGFVVYESFEGKDVAETGVMPMPKEGEKVLGGHAVAAVGYNEEKKVIIVRNSWGTKWGQEGYFEMPYDFILDPEYASDFWVIDLVDDESDTVDDEKNPEKPSTEE